MLKKFCVENFKNFENQITLNLSTPSNYAFNTDVISDGCLTKGIIYGPNGGGKTNFGLAVFDIILHLTDKEKLLYKYRNYTNLNSQTSIARFEYTFSFLGKELVYQYNKVSDSALVEERLVIDGAEVLYYNFVRKKGQTALKGAETLNLVAESTISRVKFIRSNAILEKDDTNAVFTEFMDFVDRMLLFYSLDSKGYQGYKVGSRSITEGIIESGRIKEFEQFLQDHGVNYNLVAKEVDGKKQLYCKFGKKTTNLLSIASTGTVSLTLFYYWYLEMQKASLVFIDEFDAFYHFESAVSLVKLLRSLNRTQILLTTHNTDLMNNDLLRPDCYFLLNSKKISPVSELTSKELRQAHNLQKMYKAGAFNE